MKRLKLILAMLSVSVLFACIGVFAACGGSEDPNQEYYTVTIAPYNGESGTVSVTSPASDKGYVKDEQVTVTVTPATNYEADEVKVNGTAVTLNAGKYTFKVAGNTVISATFEYVGWRNIAWHNDTLGTLTFDADYNMTLTPEGGEPQEVTIVTVGVDLSEGFPVGEIAVTVGAQAYQVSFGTYLVFKLGNDEYTFDSDPITDFAAYVGTWKQYNSTNELVVTATGLTYDGETYSEYYTAFDGSHYVKYQKTAITKPQRYRFGYIDNTKAVIYLEYGASIFHFTKDGTLPTVAFPAEFYGEWWNETYYTLAISASGATINESGEVKAFSVLGVGEEAIIYAYYDDGFCIFYMVKNADTGENEVILYNRATENVFTAVKSEQLPTEYRGDWTQLVGDKTLTVDTAGNLTYEGKTRATTRDSQDFGFHFLTEAGKKATLMYFPNGGVLALDDGDGHIYYYAKTALSELNDITTDIPAGTWTSGTKTLTVSAEGKITLAEGTEAAKSVRLVFEDVVPMDEVQHYNGEAIYDGVYYTTDYNTESGVITLGYYNDLENGTTTTLTFTGGAQGGGGQQSDPTKDGIPEAVKGSWTEYVIDPPEPAEPLSKHTLVISAEGNIKFDGTDVTESATVTGGTLKFTAGTTQYTAVLPPEANPNADEPENNGLILTSTSGNIYMLNEYASLHTVGEVSLHGTTWATAVEPSSTLSIDSDGHVTVGGKAAAILSYYRATANVTDGVVTREVRWTMFVAEGEYYKATVWGNQIKTVDYDGETAKDTFINTVHKNIPEALYGEWCATPDDDPTLTIANNLVVYSDGGDDNVTLHVNVTGTSAADYVLTFTDLYGDTYTCKLRPVVGGTEYGALDITYDDETTTYIRSDFESVSLTGTILEDTQWADDDDGGFYVDAHGVLKNLNDDDVTVLSYEEDDATGTCSLTFIVWGIFDGTWYKATVADDTMTVVDSAEAPYGTFTKQESTAVDIPEEFYATWDEFTEEESGRWLTISRDGITANEGTISEISYTGDNANEYVLSFKWTFPAYNVDYQCKPIVVFTDRSGAVTYGALIVSDGADEQVAFIERNTKGDDPDLAINALKDTTWKDAAGTYTLTNSRGWLSMNGNAAFILTQDVDVADTDRDQSWTMLCTITDTLQSTTKTYYCTATYAGSKITITGIGDAPIELTKEDSSAGGGGDSGGSGTETTLPDGMAGTWYDLSHDTSVTIATDGVSLPETGNEKTSEFTPDAAAKTITMALGEGATVTITLLDANTIEVKIASSDMTQTSYYFGSALFPSGYFQGGLQLDSQTTMTLTPEGDGLGTISIEGGAVTVGENYPYVVYNGMDSEGFFSFIIVEQEPETYEITSVTYYKLAMGYGDSGMTFTVTDRAGHSYKYNSAVTD